MEISQSSLANTPKEHPRTIGWIGTVANGMAGSNLSFYILAGILANQGSAAILLMVIATLISWLALPGWIELVLLNKNRVGGIAANCVEAFAPYNSIIASLVAICYWSCWIPVTSFSSLLCAQLIQQWWLHSLSVPFIATALVVFFTGINLCGLKWATRVNIPIAIAAVCLTLLAIFIPVLTDQVSWQQAMTFHLTSPFGGTFGQITSIMAGFYLIGYATPGFEQAACHVGETKQPEKNIPRGMYISAIFTGFYSILMPIVWLGLFGPDNLQKEFSILLGPAFAPLFGPTGKLLAMLLVFFNMALGIGAPLINATRTLYQSAEDGLAPQIFAKRMAKTDAPWVAILLSAVLATAILWLGAPQWLYAATNLNYLISMSLPSIAVWLLRRNSPQLIRTYTAPRGTITLGLFAAIFWVCVTLLGFQQFGLPAVLSGLLFAYAGSLFYLWRYIEDQIQANTRPNWHSLHTKLSGTMLLVLTLDGAGYLLAVFSIPNSQIALKTGLEDIFVMVALLTISVGLILPGIIANAATKVAAAAKQLAQGTMADFSRAMQALGKGNLDAAYARINTMPITVRTKDEVGEMAHSFNALQDEIKQATIGLDNAREGLRRARNDLIKSEMRSRGIHDTVADGIITFNEQNIIQSLNPAAERIFGYTLTEVVGNSLTVLIPPLDPHNPNKSGFILFNTKNPEALGKNREVSARHKNGNFFPAEFTITKLQLPEEQLYIGSIRDISIRKNLETQLIHQATHDSLTQLPNRLLLLDRLQQVIIHAKKNNTFVALLFLDLDRFKIVNDSLGHNLGDDLLVAVANRLKDVMRETDTLARLGGDEFIILVNSLTYEDEVDLIAKNILTSLVAPFKIKGHDLSVRASIGVSFYPTDAENAEALLKNSDAAMYLAKEKGRDNFQFYTAEMNIKALQRLSLENDLRNALERQEFVLYYQPLINLRSGKIMGAEALLRWQHPEKGLIMPDEFIPLMEETGLIIPAGEWILKTACQQNKNWQEQGLPPIRMAVNLSTRQFKHSDIMSTVERSLKQANLPAQYLELELTETILMENVKEVITLLNNLKALDVMLTIDDFGTGYSSLSYLKRFPVDKLKIDRSFIRDITVNRDDAAIAVAIIAMAKSLNLTVLAEGVETAEQLNFLSQHNCDEAQGFYFSKAVDTEAFQHLLRS